MDYLHAWLQEEVGPPLQKESTRLKKQPLRYGNTTIVAVHIFGPDPLFITNKPLIPPIICQTRIHVHFLLLG